MLRTMRLLRSIKLKHCPTDAQRLRLTAELDTIMGHTGRAVPLFLCRATAKPKAG